MEQLGDSDECQRAGAALAIYTRGGSFGRINKCGERVYQSQAPPVVIMAGRRCVPKSGCAEISLVAVLAWADRDL